MNTFVFVFFLLGLQVPSGAAEQVATEAANAADQSGTINWSADSVSRQSGSNEIVVRARDAANNSRTDTIAVTYEGGDPGPGDTFQDCPDCPMMVVIPGGSFTQGAPASEPESSDAERPQRLVNVPTFAVGQTEVTFAQWDVCVADGGCTHTPGDNGWGRQDRPVINISWNDAQEYVAWLSMTTGQTYRLPTESEWEYATRSGSTGRFNIGDCITVEQANFAGSFPAEGCPSGVWRQQTTSVATFQPNAFGLYDTHGNAYEWVEDCWNATYDSAPVDGSAWVLGNCTRSLARGGSWNGLGRGLRSAARGTLSSRDSRDASVGFRVARDQAQSIPDQPPAILTDNVHTDRFEQQPIDLFPKIEFITDRNAYFDAAGQTHVVAVRVFDQNGNLVPNPMLNWSSANPGQLGIDSSDGGAVLESLGNWDGPIEYTVAAPDQGISASGQAVMADFQPDVIQIPSSWVRAVVGDRTETHQVTIISNPETDQIGVDDIVVSGDYAGVMVRVLAVGTDNEGRVVLTAEPAAINEVYLNFQQNAVAEPLLVRVEADVFQTRYTIRSLRDDVLLYQRLDRGATVNSLLQCSGNLNLDQNLDVDFINLEWSITPYADIDVSLGGLELFEVGVNGMVSVQAQIAVNMSAGVALSGSCGPNLPDIKLPGVFVYGIDISPSIFPGVNLSVAASASTGAGWVPLSGLERTWELQAGVRYTDLQGWMPVNDYTASGSQPTASGFNVDAALALELAAGAELGAGLSFCAGTCLLFPSLVKLTFLEVAGGPFWRLNLAVPTAVNDPGYQGPKMTTGVAASASAGLTAGFFESGILNYLPFAVSFGSLTPVFEEELTFFETSVDGSINCSPSCANIPESGGTINLSLSLNSDANGNATFWLKQPGVGQLTLLGSTPVVDGQTTLQYDTGGLLPGEYQVYGRMGPDGAAYWFADLLPLAPAGAIGSFTVTGGGGPGPGDTFKDCPDCPTMVIIPAGTFMQGSPASEPESRSLERPQRQVTVPSFAMGQTEVTFEEWEVCVSDGGCTYVPDDRGWGRGNRPVINVSWFDAREYVLWLIDKTGQDYRLPSESEWEYSARAGTVGRFNTGDCITTGQSNYSGTTPALGCPAGEFRGRTLPVRSFAANAFGLHDTHGNAWEWVEDCWNTSYADAPVDGSAWFEGDCSQAVLRSGGWDTTGKFIRSASRDRVILGHRFHIGFRVARSLEP